MGKVAFVTGANGITGSAILEHLARRTSPDEWSRIIVTSRSPFVQLVHDPRIRFVALDFTKDPGALAAEMREAGCGDVTHAYFSSYVHKDDFAELQAANKVLFENFLLALQEVAGGEPSQQRQEEGRLRSVTLQTGGKYYMVHASPAPTPCREDDPRRAAAEDNFYYPQEDFLAAQQAGKRWTWSVIRPTGIIGCTGKPNGMNLALTYAVYFLICRELGVEARMPTNQTYWDETEDQSDAGLIAEQTVWASTTPAAANQALNCVNGDHFRFRYTWPRLAAYFGARASPDQAFEKPRPARPGPAGVLLQQEFSMAEWMRDKQPVWESLCERAGVPEAKATFGFVTPFIVDWAYRRTWGATLCMTKARKLGWTGYIDSYESNVRTFERFRALKQIP